MDSHWQNNNYYHNRGHNHQNDISASIYDGIWNVVKFFFIGSTFVIWYPIYKFFISIEYSGFSYCITNDTRECNYICYKFKQKNKDNKKC